MCNVGNVLSYAHEDHCKQDAKEFIKKAVTLAMYRDNSSGGVIRLIDITKTGYNREYISYNELEFPKNK